jgi:hypothetical protein
MDRLLIALFPIDSGASSWWRIEAAAFNKVKYCILPRFAGAENDFVLATHSRPSFVSFFPPKKLRERSAERREL